MDKIKKFQNIEFLRIIGCLAIVCYHLFLRLCALSTENCQTQEMFLIGSLAVELFFIISGILIYNLIEVPSKKYLTKKYLNKNIEPTL